MGKVAIIVFSGEIDRALAAMNIAVGAAASGFQVSMFFTFWGLDIIKKERGRKALGRSWLARAFNWLLGGVKNLPLSRLNFAGASPILMRRMMRAHNVAQLEEMMEAAPKLGVRLVACEMAMHILELGNDDLWDAVEDVVGVAGFLEDSKDAQVLFI